MRSDKNLDTEAEVDCHNWCLAPDLGYWGRAAMSSLDRGCHLQVDYSLVDIVGGY